MTEISIDQTGIQRALPEDGAIAEIRSLIFSILISALAIAALSVVAGALLYRGNETLVLGEARERRVFILAVAALLPICLASLRMADKWAAKKNKSTLFVALIAIGLWMLFCVACIPALFDMASLVTGGSLMKTITSSPFPIACFAASIAILAVPTLRFVSSGADPSGVAGNVVYGSLLAVLSILIVSHCIYGIAGVGEEYRWYVDFDAVLYSVSQVAAGRTLLADLPTQYGLYAEFIGPLVRVFGFSIFGITALFAAMSAASYLAVARVFFALTKSVLPRVLWAIGAGILVNFLWQYFTPSFSYDPYYQYFPLRLFFPSVSLLIFNAIINKECQVAHVVAFSAFLMVGVIWNLDSGIPAFGAFLAYLVLSAFFCKDDRRSILRMLSVTIVAAVATLGFFALYMTWKAGESIPWAEWFRYQRIFYVSGAYSILLPLHPHPWMAVIALYVLGILGFMRSASQEAPDRFWSVMLYLSIMGLGLFPYYQHRAHDAVFLAVCWPAYFMAFALTDRLRNFVVERGLPRTLLLTPLPALLMGAVASGFFLYHMPVMVSTSINDWRAALDKKDTPMLESVRFMRAQTQSSHSQSVAILAPNQGLYFAELGLPSAIKGPGIAESFLPEDKTALVDDIQSAKPTNLFIRSENGGIPSGYTGVTKGYRLVGQDANGMLYYRAIGG